MSLITNQFVMKLIADSGSTKTQWYVVSATKPKAFRTVGFNPYFYTTKGLIDALRVALLLEVPLMKIEVVQFYGAGCGDTTQRQKMQGALEQIMPQATVEVQTDLLAAAHATAGQQAGICCILGTGSNSCYYDGNQIVDNLPSLGYLLGDEGAGTHLGRMLLQAYFYREMPATVAAAMEQQYEMNRTTILKELIQSKTPNQYLASFADFAVDQKEQPFIQGLIRQNMELFITRHIQKYRVHGNLPVHFVGSIAKGFEFVLRPLLLKHGLPIGQIIKEPFPSLLHY